MELFNRFDLDVEVIWIQGTLAVASLISKEIDLLYCMPQTAIGAAAGGADVAFLASVYNRAQYRVMAAPGIASPEQLRGKLFAIGRLHDIAHFYLRLALQAHRMDPDQDVKVVTVGGQGDRIAAMKAGRVAATIVNPANALILEKLGFKTILDLETLGLPVMGTSLAARRDTISGRRSSLGNFLRAMVQGIEKVQSDPDTSKKVLAKYLRLKDADIIEENYRFNSGKYLDRAPFVPLQGLRYAIDSLVPTVPAVKKLKPESLIDHSLLEEALKGAKQ